MGSVRNGKKNKTLNITKAKKKLAKIFEGYSTIVRAKKVFVFFRIDCSMREV